MAKIILVTGGARSGKSQFAETTTLGLRKSGDKPAFYIATSEPFDTEMRGRIALHQQRRGAEWQSVEEPVDLAGALEQTDNTDGQPRLIDCLTLWLNNLIYYGHDVEAMTAQLSETLLGQQADMVFVTNEIGSGMVPENPQMRLFRDQAGLLNQRLAKQATEVYVTISGIAVNIKSDMR